MHESNNVWKIYGIAMIVVLAAILLVFTGFKTPYQFNLEAVYGLNDNWVASSTGEAVTLPQVVKGVPGEPVSIQRTLEQAFSAEQVICIRGSLQAITVTLDGEKIYENLQTNHSVFNSPRISVWNLIHVPADSAGKLLKIQFQTDVEALNGHFGKVIWGSESGIISYLAYHYGKDLPLVMLIFVFGLILMVVPLIFNDYKRYELVYLGLFSSGIALWFFAESTLMQFVTGNSWLLGGAGCLLLSLFPIPILLFIRTSVLKTTGKIMEFLAMGFAGNTVIITMLQILGIMHLFESLFLTHAWMVVALVGTTICFVKEIRVLGNPTAMRFLKTILPLLVCVIIEMATFYFVKFQNNTYFIKIGLLLFLGLQTIDSIKQLIVLIKRSYAAEMYQRLAFQDRLTGGANRMAFDEAIDALFEEKSHSQHCRLIIFDLNSLKRINDSFGHRVGDEAIVAGFRSIEKAFKTIGNCYRIGGDEFACLCRECDEVLYVERMEFLHELLELESARLPYPLGITAGSALLDYSVDQKVGDFMHRADMNMYEHKLQYTAKVGHQAV